MLTSTVNPFKDKRVEVIDETPTSCERVEQLFTCAVTRKEVQEKIFKDKKKSKSQGDAFHLSHTLLKFHLTPGEKNSLEFLNTLVNCGDDNDEIFMITPI
jgi:hypothetical protein